MDLSAAGLGEPFDGDFPHLIAPAPRLESDRDLWHAGIRRIEELGFHAVAVSEHYTNGWTMEPITGLAFAAAATERVAVLPLVLNSDLHHPARLAKAMATADVLSGGRVVVGLGAGWLSADYDAIGHTFERPGIRLARFGEALTIMRQFFDGPCVDFAGVHYTVRDLEALPKPVRAGGPPILIGGGGPRLLEIAGRFADIVGVHVTLGARGFDAHAAREVSRQQISHKIEVANRAAAAVGRPRPRFQLTPAVVVIDGKQCTAHRPGFTDYIRSHPEEFTDTPAVLIGDASDVADQIRRWHAELCIGLWHLGSDLSSVSKVIARADAA